MTNQNKNCNTLFMQPKKGFGCCALQSNKGENLGESGNTLRRMLVSKGYFKPPKRCRGGDAMC